MSHYETVTYPSPVCMTEILCVASCCTSGMAASPKSKYWPISEALGVAIVTGCHFELSDGRLESGMTSTPFVKVGTSNDYKARRGYKLERLDLEQKSIHPIHTQTSHSFLALGPQMSNAKGVKIS
jgi:hypothetical protein